MGKKKKKGATQVDEVDEMPDDIAALQQELEEGDEEPRPSGKKRKREETAKSAEAMAGKKKKRKKKGNEESAEIEKTASGDGESNKKDVDADAYRAAGVVFFTRAKNGSIDKVLLALEERKVQASHLGLEKSGKVTQKMIVFPQGRREKKDKSDPVETAKREFIEETGDFGSLSQYLDVADFDSDDDEASPESSKTNCKNGAFWFAPALMVVLFCEIPREAAEKEGKCKAEPKPDLPEISTNEKKGNTHSYRVGKMDHVDCVWVDIAELRKTLKSDGKAPKLRTRAGEEYHIFPMNLSVLRIPESREFLGATEKTT